MTDDDISASLVERVRQAAQRRQRLDIGPARDQGLSDWALDLRQHSGILDLDIDSRSVSVRAGTRLQQLNLALKQVGYTLPFEPPLFSTETMVGSMVARGMAGPRRPWAGDVADNLLGGKLIDGQGQLHQFGSGAHNEFAAPEMCQHLVGSAGKLALLTEVSLRIIRCPQYSRTLRLEIDPSVALQQEGLRTGLRSPINAFCHTGEALYLRLEGNPESVSRACDLLGGDRASDSLWEDLRELRLAFFRDPRPLWELSVAEGAPLTRLPGHVLLEWNGRRRWLKSDAPAAAIRRAAQALGGHARCFDTRRAMWIGSTVDKAMKLRLDPLEVFGPAPVGERAAAI
ncbi:FAD-binding protein [Pseudomonas nitroreducens]|uniref:FAD-binding protein n=1 Tax=Pseudomonas nitroreducens TaxID=46680 RepID=A0A6G6J337_PSENT|nr:FAD-binding protein [Pseudomonas nitroreducens]QIE89805.1 FAD-binding protein [Pseudomonas nitroreducens]